MQLKTRDILFYVPLCFLLIGVIVHIVGLLNVVNNKSFSLWNIWVDFSMLFIDIAAFYGLLVKKKWGYYASMAVFALSGLVQLFLGISHMTSRGEIPFEIQNFGAIVVCVIAAICLYNMKDELIEATS